MNLQFDLHLNKIGTYNRPAIRFTFKIKFAYKINLQLDLILNKICL